MTTITRTEELVAENSTNGKIKQTETEVKKIENGKITNGTGPYTVDTKGKLPSEIGTDYSFKRKIVWFNAIGFLILHIMAAYGLFLCLTSCKIWTTLWMLAVTFAAGEGITMGAHRMWSHKTFKANFLVRLVLILLQTVAGQNCLYIWARDHRLHHKYSDTDADPHNSNRGFFFSHMGWLMSRKHPAVISKGKTIDMSDLEADPLVMIQKTYYNPLYLIFAICIPVTVPVWLWNESYINSFFTSYMLRYILSLHVTWLVNSAAHMYGTKPYDINMQPVESWIVSFLSVGEGWHNYHHAFPWDYRASEYGAKFNITTKIIDMLAYLGLAYDLRAAPEHMIKHRALKAGDGSHPLYGPLKEKQDLEQNIPIYTRGIQENSTQEKLEVDTENNEEDKQIKDPTQALQNGIRSKEELSFIDREVMNGNAVNGDIITKRNIKQKQILKK